MNKILQVLQQRGFIKQCTDIEGLSRAMDEREITFYVGCDPTYESLHIGHMVPFFAFRHLTDAGHRGIALMGGGTARIGDPSGKSEARKLLDYSQIDTNTQRFIAQLDPFLHFNTTNVITDNNKVWLEHLNYIDFLREIGKHFSVNRMLAFEAYKMRMETGLSFIEFNYQLLQSFDFLQLYKKYGCCLQIGGDDQWGNIVSGIDLIRRMESAECFGLTFPLITTADGKKMGKTESGALFLDPQLVSPWDFFQYWRNVDDTDVERFLLMFTFLPFEECQNLARSDAINKAKEILAFEVTRLIHGEAEAAKALDASHAAFGHGGNLESVPTVSLAKSAFEQGMNVLELFVAANLAASKSEARRLVEQGGASIEGKEVRDPKHVVTIADFLDNNSIILRAGKKRLCRITFI